MIKPYYQDEWVTIYHGDCREILPVLPKVDLVLTDPPYGVTQNERDLVVDLSPFLKYPAVIFSQQPFTTDLINRHRDIFRYDLIWDKELITGFLNAKIMPLRQHEIILIFGEPPYNPQMTKGHKNHSIGKPISPRTNNNYGDFGYCDNSELLRNNKYPTSIIDIPKSHPAIALHRTEKPVELISWLVSTYSNPNQIVLDPFLGSGTTAYCAKKLGRHCIGIEIEEKYCEIAAKRCMQTVMNLEIPKVEVSQLKFN